MLPPAAVILRSALAVAARGRRTPKLSLVVAGVELLVEPLQIREVGGVQPFDDAGVDVGQRSRAA